MDATQEMEYANRQHENADRQARYAGWWDISREEIEEWERHWAVKSCCGGNTQKEGYADKN